MSTPIKRDGYTARREQYYDEAVRLYYEEGMCFQEISRVLPPAHTTIKRWIINFATENNLTLTQPCKMGTAKTKTQQSVEQLTMEAEIKQLKAEKARLESDLRMVEMKADLYNEIITVAEKQFNIQIRKKAGAKR